MAATHDLTRMIRKIVASPTLHARWLNTFSYLEYIGFRKIVKSQTAENMSMATLLHANEESRHALLLKRLALKVGGKAFDNYRAENLLCGAAAENYFQTLDRSCEKSFPAEMPEARRARLTYLYVTWLVEVRALDVYNVYQGTTEATGIKGLLAEEAGHLEHVEARLQSEDLEFESRRLALKDVEAELYRGYLQALSQELARTEVVSHA